MNERTFPVRRGLTVMAVALSIFLPPMQAVAQRTGASLFRAGNPAPVLERLNANGAANGMSFSVIGFTEMTRASTAGGIEYMNKDALIAVPVMIDAPPPPLDNCTNSAPATMEAEIKDATSVRHSFRVEDAWSFSGSVEAQVGQSFGSHTRVNASYTYSEDRIAEADTTYTVSISERLSTTVNPRSLKEITVTRYEYNLDQLPLVYQQPIHVQGPVQYASAPGLVGLHRWYIPSNGPHQYYNTDWSAPAGGGNVYQGIEVAIFPGPGSPNTYPLVSVYIQRDGARFLIVDDDRGLINQYAPASIRTAADTVGYVYRDAQPGTVAVKMYYNGQHPVYLVEAKEQAYVAANGFPEQDAKFTFYGYPVQTAPLEQLTGNSQAAMKTSMIGAIRGRMADWTVQIGDGTCN